HRGLLIAAAKASARTIGAPKPSSKSLVEALRSGRMPHNSKDGESLMYQGVLDLPWWGYVVIVLATTHSTIAGVTIYLHRHQAHRALDLHPIASHFFRFWLWLTTGMVTKEWAAIHRKHHAKCEAPEDPY